MNRSRIIRSFLAALALMTGYSLNIDAATAYQGYTIMAAGQYAYLIDMTGTVQHKWTAGGTIRNQAYLLEDGSIVAGISSCNGGDHNGAYPSGRFQKISWDGTVTWDYIFCDATKGLTPGYDIEPLPNGNILVPCDSRSVSGKTNGTIVEIKPSGASGGEVVWQYSLPDSIASSGSSSGGGGMGGGMGGGGGGGSSGTYINSVSYNPDLDCILIDMQTPVRKFAVIDHSGSGSVKFTLPVGTDRLHAAMWVTKYYLGTKTVIADADTTAMRLNDLLVVGNQDDKVLEASYTTKALISSVNIKFSFADHEGSCQRLPNGNTLVCAGEASAVVEIDDQGTVVGTVSAKSTGRCLRAYRYGPNFAGVSKISGTAVSRTMMKINSISGIYSYSAGKISIVNQSCSKVDLKIMSVNGKTVYTASSFEKNAQFSVKGLVPGAYLVEVKHAAGMLKTSLIKM